MKDNEEAGSILVRLSPCVVGLSLGTDGSVRIGVVWLFSCFLVLYYMTLRGVFGVRLGGLR